MAHLRSTASVYRINLPVSHQLAFFASDVCAQAAHADWNNNGLVEVDVEQEPNFHWYKVRDCLWSRSFRNASLTKLHYDSLMMLVLFQHQRNVKTFFKNSLDQLCHELAGLHCIFKFCANEHELINEFVKTLFESDFWKTGWPNCPTPHSIIHECSHFTLENRMNYLVAPITHILMR